MREFTLSPMDKGIDHFTLSRVQAWTAHAACVDGPQFKAAVGDLRSRMEGGSPRRNHAGLSVGALLTIGLHMVVAAAVLLSGSVIVKMIPPEPVVLVDVAVPLEPVPAKPLPIVTPPPLTLAHSLIVPPPEVHISASPAVAPRAAVLEQPSAPRPPPAQSTAAIETWQAKLLRHLNRYKRYPSVARAKRQQGVAFVHFAMDRHGRVVSARIQTSSGFAALDHEALALVNRAQPLPKPPEDVIGSPVVMVVPVDFFVRS